MSGASCRITSRSTTNIVSAPGYANACAPQAATPFPKRVLETCQPVHDLLHIQRSIIASLHTPTGPPPGTAGVV